TASRIGCGAELGQAAKARTTHICTRVIAGLVSWLIGFIFLLGCSFHSLLLILLRHILNVIFEVFSRHSCQLLKAVFPLDDYEVANQLGKHLLPFLKT